MRDRGSNIEGSPDGQVIADGAAVDAPGVGDVLWRARLNPADVRPVLETLVEGFGIKLPGASLKLAFGLALFGIDEIGDHVLDFTVGEVRAVGEDVIVGMVAKRQGSRGGLVRVIELERSLRFIAVLI